MKVILISFGLCLAALGVSAAPSNSGCSNCMPKTCVVQHTDSQDDSPAVEEAIKDCGNDAVIEFSDCVEYNIWNPIVFDLSNTVVKLLGNINFPQNISAIQAVVAKNETGGVWLTFNGENNTFVGNDNPKCGIINGYGQQWWDKVEQKNRAAMLAIHSDGFKLLKIKAYKAIYFNFGLYGKNIYAEGNLIDSRSDSGSFPFNTDGFDVQGQNIQVVNNTILNGDDCLAVWAGAENIYFAHNHCGYMSHGSSIGSLGKLGLDHYDTVTNVIIENNTYHSTLFAARFKSVLGSIGLAKNVTWRHLRLHNVTFPIQLSQNHYNQESGNGTFTGAPTAQSNSTVELQDFLMEDFVGIQNTQHPGDLSCVTNPCWYTIANTTLNNIIQYDFQPDTTKNLVVKRINVVGQNLEYPTVYCTPSAIDYDPGFACVQNGLYLPDALGESF